MKLLAIGMFAVCMVYACPAWAQPRVEAGAGLGGIFLPGEGGAIHPSVNVRTNVTPRFGIDVATDFLPSGAGATGLYRIQAYHRVPVRSSALSPFVTYGMAGFFRYRHVASRERVVRETGDRLTYPAHWSGELTAPVVATVGGGVRKHLTKVLVFEAEARALIFLGERGPLSLAWRAGLVVPLGSWRR